MRRSGRALVVGLGCPDRGDDAVGPEVAAGVRQAVAAGSAVLVVDHEDPTALIGLMDDHDLVVIVDAVASGAAPGTVTTRRVGRDSAPLPARTEPGPAGTHGLGLAATIELARALQRLPEHVALVCVEATRFEIGAALSAPVQAAIPGAVDAVLALLPAGLADTQRPSPSGADASLT